MYPHLLALHSSCSPGWQNCNISLIQSSTCFATTLKQLKGPGGKLTTGLTFLSLNYDLQTQGGLQYYPVISPYSLIHPSILQEGCSLVFISSEIFNTLCLSSFSALDFFISLRKSKQQKGNDHIFPPSNLWNHLLLHPSTLFSHLHKTKPSLCSLDSITSQQPKSLLLLPTFLSPHP